MPAPSVGGALAVLDPLDGQVNVPMWVGLTAVALAGAVCGLCASWKIIKMLERYYAEKKMRKGEQGERLVEETELLRVSTY